MSPFTKIDIGVFVVVGVVWDYLVWQDVTTWALYAFGFFVVAPILTACKRGIVKKWRS